MLLNRQKCLLGLLDALGGRVSNVDFQKLLFLYCQENPAAPYEFVPYKFGAFSFTSYADRRKLLERGLLVDEEQVWSLTAAGRRALGTPASRDIAAFAHAYKALRGDALVADTYRRFPYYATRSEIARKVLGTDIAALRRIEAARCRRGAGLSTIGYEGLTLEGYLNRLLQAGTTLVCDVRRNPHSRKYGFSKRTLAKGCEGVGLRYEHLPQLGIASEDRQSLDTQADYDVLFERYRRDLLPQQRLAVGTIVAWLRAGESIALTCYEHAPFQCHRHCVGEAVAQAMGPTTGIRHL
jgi:uncharacterized protein (DUF488 family)